MSGRTAIFVDLDSLNVLYKYNDKFVAALNYKSSVARLSEMPPALGAGYDVYLCLKPRGPGEGNIVIDELSIPGLPFTVDSEELYKVLKFFRGYNGFGEVYLCNWVANYIAMARVETFKSAVYYGDRVAYMEVANSILQKFQLFESQRAFIDEMGEDVDAYGDIGLIDVDGLRARYPELSSASKAPLVAIAPLAQCYQTPVKLATSEYFEWLKDARAKGEFIRKSPEPVKTEPPVIQTESLEPPEEELVIDVPARPKKVRGKAPALAKVFVALTCISAMVLGGLVGVKLKEPPVENSDAYYKQVDERITKLRSLADVYSKAPNVMSTAQEALEYFQQSTATITVAGLEYIDGNYTVRCYTSVETDVDAFTDYVGEEYTIISTNDLGQSDDSGVLTYHFSLMFTA